MAFFRRALALAGHPCPPGAKVLDFGCGAGDLVRAYLAAGFDAYGCDIVLEAESDRLRLIQQPYRLPFDDDTFDFVVSEQVFEHVQDYRLALREIGRVLRPGGASLNIFPPRYRLLEAHVFVPLASVIQTRRWLSLWAMLGIRNRFQGGKTAAEVTELNYDFLRNRTAYLRRRQVLEEARAVFPAARFTEREMLEARKGDSRSGMIAALARRVPLLAAAYGETRMRALLLQ